MIKLSKQSKKDIQNFLLHSNKNITIKTEASEAKIQNNEQIFQTKETQQINQKIQKIKSAFTPSILNNNPDIAEQLKLLNTLDNPTKKEKIFNNILKILKDPKVLKSIIDELG